MRSVARSIWPDSMESSAPSPATTRFWWCWKTLHPLVVSRTHSTRSPDAGRRWHKVNPPVGLSAPAPSVETTKPVAPPTPASAPSHATKDGARLKARVAVLGASGYSGQEFARLSTSHPGVELAVLCSREHA